MSMASPRNRDTRENILDGCLKMFLQKNYGQVTGEDIVFFSGYTKRTIYQYFKDKNDLFIAVTDRFIQKLMNYLERFNSEPRNSLLDYILGYIGYAKNLSLYIKAMTDNKVSSHLSFMVQASMYYDGFEGKIKELFDLEQKGWEDNLRMAMEKQEIRENIDIPLTAAKFRSMSTGIDFHTMMVPHAVSVNALQLLMIDLYNDIKMSPVATANILDLL